MRKKTIMNTAGKPFNVGSKSVIIDDPKNGISFPVLVHYPTLVESKPINFGPYLIDVALNASIASGIFPIVVISHGNSGSQFVYRTISTYLATRGYIVAMIEHYGNNRRNNDLADSIKNLEYRPQHISITLDNLLKNKDFKQHIAVDKIAVIGHSFGGYGGLAAAGGKPWSMNGEAINTTKDERIKALVLMAPAAGYFSPENALDEVSLPILLLIASNDIYTPKKWTADVILNGIPNKSTVMVKEIANAGHFSFISPFPEAMKNPDFIPSNDPEGFDRNAFHKVLSLDIFNYLNEKLNVT